jgi:phosphate starvation-inducible PhoH-like protein
LRLSAGDRPWAGRYGKTWIAATHAADLFRNRRIDKIILTRPNVPCGRSLGYFPGTLEDKFSGAKPD